MDIFAVTNYLTVAVLIGLLIAVVYLIVLLHRANRIVGRFENIGSTFKDFLAQLLPAMINVQTVVSSVESVIKAFHDQYQEHHKASKKKEKHGE